MTNEPRYTGDLLENLWHRDAPLRRADELITQSAGRIRAVSFDFFDTIIWRLTGKPTNVFCEVAHRLTEQRLLPTTVLPWDYEVLRRHGEIKTRECQNAKDPTWEDISINNIYSQMKAVVKDPTTAVAIEHAAECDLCVLNPIMAGFIRHLRNHGLKLLVISDIYFSSEQVKDILRANKFDPDIFEFVLTSCDEGVCKGTGNLYRRALKKLKLEPDEILHIGDNAVADVTGARKASVCGCHYPQATLPVRTILDREQFLLGGQSPAFSANSLRLLAARLFPFDTDEGFFGQSGALLMGPVLTRFAGWACDQFITSGVRKVGALMREGELFGQLLQRESDERGLDLKITPLYINRRATDLAAIGQLSADNLIAWLEARSTLLVRTILSQFGLSGTEFRNAPIALDAKADQPDKILQLARFLFTPKIAQRIEAKSAEERRKILGYLRPWLDGGEPFGVCDIGYSASAQTQLKRILDLEKIPNHVVGCYLVSTERAADRVLDGVDIRHFLGMFGHPDFFFRSFMRSPAFMEQSVVASVGTTLGYEQRPDGTVVPLLDRMPFDAAMLRRQQSFKQGVLEFQILWHSVRRLRPGLLDGSTELSRRILTDVDAGLAPILGRATAFPLQQEVERFGSLALDDCYYADAYKPLCGEKDLETLQQKGFASILGQPDIHWPHGVFHRQNPRLASDFFSYGKALLLCQPHSDGDNVSPELSIIIRTGKNLAQLRECLARVKSAANLHLNCEIIILLPKEDKSIYTLAQEFTSKTTCIRILEQAPNQNPVQHINHAVDGAAAPLLMLLDDGVLLPTKWDDSLLSTLTASADIGMVFPSWRSQTDQLLSNPNCAVRCFLARRSAFIEGLGFNENLGPGGAALNLALNMRIIKWQVVPGIGLATELKISEARSALSVADGKFLADRCPDPVSFVISLFENATSENAQPSRDITLDWIGSFLDHGSLSHVNRELTGALENIPAIRLQRVSNGVQASAGFENLAYSIASTASADAVVTVRHVWPPDWRRPRSGKLVVIQPWEFGALPVQWVQQARDVDEFWVPSEYVRRVYIESGVPAHKMVVVPNGVNPEKFHPLVVPMKLATAKTFKFLFVGGTIYRKGPDVLLKAYLEQFTAADDVCLVIKDFGGATVYAGQTFEAKIRAAQAEPNSPEILYLNEELPPDALPGLYTACDSLVHPYRGEGFGLPILEAMACGLPAIVTAGGSADDFATDEFAYRIPAVKQSIGDSISGLKLVGQGWLLEPDVAALGERMKWVVTHRDEARALGTKAAAHVRREWTWERAAAVAEVRLRELIARQETIAEKPKARPIRQAAPIVLPPCALQGHLAEARRFFQQKKLPAAWGATRAALKQRPFHPEAYLLLAEIALAAQDSVAARDCAQFARHIAPDFRPAKKFLKGRLYGKAKPEWLVLPEEIGKQKSDGRCHLSICLIVKNEERFLDQCLASVKGLADQIVVVDTGSTDRTVEIARKHGAQVHSFAWCDDFSAARNAVLEHATGDWILMLDADEELPPENHAALRKLLRADSVMAWRLPIIEAGREAEGCCYVPRLFRNAPALFYVGRVHEQIFSSIEVRRQEWGLENRLGDAALRHHGYRPDVVKDRNKIERNLRLLEKAIEELPDEPNLLMNLGLELVRSGHLDTGVEQYWKAFEIMSEQPKALIVPETREMLLTQMCTHLMAQKRFDEIARVLTSPLARAGGLTASLHFSLGLTYLERKQFSDAADQLRQCLAKRDQPALTLVNLEIRKAGPHHCLALCLDQMGEPDAAVQEFQRAIDADPQSRPARCDYARFLAAHERQAEALNLLFALANEQPGEAQVWLQGGQLALSQPKFLEVALDWTAEATRHLPRDPAVVQQRAEALLLAGQCNSALLLWRQLPSTPNPAIAAALVLCETVVGENQFSPSAAAEVAVSREFVKWYQRLLQFSALPTMESLNTRIETLKRILPTAAGILAAALAEVSVT